ncbi:MAG: chemotaxis protein CheW [Planctomycetia bacterium]|nr:chemotaxis protein CheW [Planctomycetia bacterium]
MNLAGELVISRARFARVGDRLRETLGSQRSMQAFQDVFSALGRMSEAGADGGDRQTLRAELDALRSQARGIQTHLEPVRREIEALARAHASINELGEAIHQLDLVTDGIQKSVMDTRMVPIGPLFTRFKRVIRDITRLNGKRVQLVIDGEKTELDKRMIDELGDPLIHMVRNSADHGIELPEVRRAAGKPEEGTITLNAYHRGNSIVVEVSDDGKGLPTERILRKAIEKGIVTEADAERMTPRQIHQLIWEPGLSTAEKVTEVSGRGMGMDIVKSKIEGLNGTIDLDSTPGRGTTLTIKLPLTLAILPSLMVDVDGDVFAMPIESVVEIVSVGGRDLTTLFGQRTARVRGRVVSVVRLDDVFSFNRGGSGAGRNQGDELTLVIVGESGHEIGLAVDRVIGEEDVVIKSMAENYKNIAGIAGASVLGNGQVSLILDVPALIGMASNTVCANA